LMVLIAIKNPALMKCGVFNVKSLNINDDPCVYTGYE
jgi:hypothetical protein